MLSNAWTKTEKSLVSLVLKDILKRSCTKLLFSENMTKIL